MVSIVEPLYKSVLGNKTYSRRSAKQHNIRQVIIPLQTGQHGAPVDALADVPSANASYWQAVVQPKTDVRRLNACLPQNTCRSLWMTGGRNLVHFGLSTFSFLAMKNGSRISRCIQPATLLRLRLVSCDVPSPPPVPARPASMRMCWLMHWREDCCIDIEATQTLGHKDLRAVWATSVGSKSQLTGFACKT